ncbi:hypothetical protein [Psychromonas sp. 14N.309.X.WAT.B.A12]|jgi:hypothetical protein|uniref:hypothetical protein n=1 Tax=unclassified Psychromonas TaxID=2614957 RepID=UPI0025B17724|nr:hypothetical protein [Psychromonas sp. 14N.309.X.WAT.B.A12]MDN2662285.1 hypothetical protein [Psychromonas sp. 14N.309.X.WAT.B.A12]
MKMTKLLLFAACVAPLLIIDTAQSAINNQCTQIEINQVYQHDQLEPGNTDSVSEIYEAQIATLNDFAKQQGLNKLTIKAIPPELDAANAKPEKSEITIAMTFERDNDASIIDKINIELKPLNFSYSAVILKNILCEV